MKTMNDNTESKSDNSEALKIHPGRFLKSSLHFLAMNCPVDELRGTLYKMRGTKIERNVTFGFQVFLEDLHPELITIKEGADIGPRVTVLTNDSVFFHLGDPALYKVRTKEVIIGKNCYVGAGAIILPGVIIGDNTIIAAGSIVTKSIPPESVAMGIPARVVCSREEWARNHPFKP